MKQILALFTCYLLIVNQLPAQSNEVCGFVKHFFDKIPVPGVKVFIENSIAVAITDEAGAFCINLTGKESKIIFEKENYFKTFTIANAEDFLSIEMIKNTEQDLAFSKGLKPENIKNLNSPSGRAVNTMNATERMEEEAIEAEEFMDGSISYETKMSSRRSATLSKVAAPPSGPAGPAGSAGAAAISKTATTSKRRSAAPTAASVYDGAVAIKGARTSAKEYYIDGKKRSTSEAPREDVAETKQKEIKAGRLTAGEIHDFSKWELWNDISENELSSYKDIWAIYPNERYTIQAVTEQGFPIADATVNLTIDSEIVWTAKTDNTGKAELWNVLFKNENKLPAKKETTNAKATINYKGIENKLPQLKRFEEGINVITFKQNCEYSKNVDIAFVVDATGSMGDEIDFLKVELLDVIERVQTKFKDLNIRLGNVFYRDKTDAYLTKNSPLTKNIKAGVAFIKDQKAGGGGDFPEAVDAGLEEAVNDLQWSNQAVARILFLVLDAPPHQNKAVNKKLQTTINKAAQKGIRIVPIVGSGIDKSTEYLLRSCALATNGHYIFLTDHSGIGGAHLKPTTDSYDVKSLNDLLVDIVMRYVQVQDCDAKDEPLVIGSEPNAKVNIAPNPNDGRFLIESTTDLKELFITDANGKILIRFTDFATGQNQVDIANFPTGTYYVRYEQEGKVVTQKVVKR